MVKHKLGLWGSPCINSVVSQLTSETLSLPSSGTVIPLPSRVVSLPSSGTVIPLPSQSGS